MVILICVGSSCHLKGSYNVIQLMKSNVEKYHLTDKVVLKGTFCLGKCDASGVSVKIDDEIITGVTKDNFDQVFKKYVLDVIN